MIHKHNSHKFLKFCLFIFLIFFTLSLSACALLQLPFNIVGGVFDILGNIFKIAQKIPKPPWWIFL